MIYILFGLNNIIQIVDFIFFKLKIISLGFDTTVFSLNCVWNLITVETMR